MKDYIDVVYKQINEKDLKLDIYTPDSVNFTTVIWFHGGGLESGSYHYEKLAEAIVEKGYGFVSAEYRMYPNAKYPEFIEDAADAVSYTLKNINKYGGDGKAFVSGQSAGAYITMMLCLNHDFLLNAGANEENILGYISDSAQQTCHFNILREKGIDRAIERIDETAPIWYVSRDLNIKPLKMIYYSDDMICRPEQNKLMFASIKRLIPNVVLDMVELSGGHCDGSVYKNENGEFPFVLELIDFCKKIEE